MKILFDISHPAHVHYFKNMIWSLLKNGSTVIVTVKSKEMTTHLLDALGLKYTIIGKNRRGVIPKILGIAIYTIKLFFICLYHKPDLIINASLSAAFVARLTGKYHIALEDTFNMEQVRLYLPFTSLLITGMYAKDVAGKKQLKLPFYQELLYLHPRYFQPDIGVLAELGVTKSQKYAIVRFVSWSASHDRGQGGLSYNNKINLVSRLSKILTVFISSEATLPQEIQQYGVQIKPEDMHDALYYSHLFIGEGATMASESAILGTPSIYVNSSQLGYIKDIQNYGLLYSFTNSEIDQENAINKAVEIAKLDNVKAHYLIKRDQMLKDKIDVTSFLVWFVENYPNSVFEMKKPDFKFDIFM